MIYVYIATDTSADFGLFIYIRHSEDFDKAGAVNKQRWLLTNYPHPGIRSQPCRAYKVQHLTYVTRYF